MKVLVAIYAVISLGVCLVLGSPLKAARSATPEGCTAKSTDANFPSPEVWLAEFSGIVPRKSVPAGFQRPDYRLSVKTVTEVEKAIQFVKRYNIRLTIINTGHDYPGRNDAPSGLSLDVSQLRGVKLDSSFTPSAEGIDLVPGRPVEQIQQIQGETAAVTFGVGINGGELNHALRGNGLFVVCAFAPTVSLGGGWGQGGGHSLVSYLYGLGVDQFLEFKIVTADGQLKVANEVSNPDLFWALRGGAAGTWGVVTQATVKAHPSPKVLARLIVIGSSTASLDSYTHSNDGSDAAGLYDSMAYLGSQLPDMADQGSGGVYIGLPFGMVGAALFFGENATEEHAKAVWDPVLETMSTFPGMQKAITSILTFPTFQDFFATLYPFIGTYDNVTGTLSDQSSTPGRLFAKRSSERYGGLFAKFVEEKLISDQELNLVWDHLNATDHMQTLALPKRNVGDAESWNDYTPDGDYNVPTPHGRVPIDNHLLARSHLEALPTSSFETKRWWASRYFIEIVGGPKTHEPNIDAVSVLPAWRKTYVICFTPYLPPTSSADILRELAPDSGAYVNEVSHGVSNWKELFWGSNYDRLSDLKREWDPNNTFWVTPGVNADLMEARDGRVCTPSPGYDQHLGNVVPESDNHNNFNALANLGDFVGVMVPYRGQPEDAMQTAG